MSTRQNDGAQSTSAVPTRTSVRPPVRRFSAFSTGISTGSKCSASEIMSGVPNRSARSNTCTNPPSRNDVTAGCARAYKAEANDTAWPDGSMSNGTRVHRCSITALSMLNASLRKPIASCQAARSSAVESVSAKERVRRTGTCTASRRASHARHKASRHAWSKKPAYATIAAHIRLSPATVCMWASKVWRPCSQRSRSELRPSSSRTLRATRASTACSSFVSA